MSQPRVNSPRLSEAFAGAGFDSIALMEDAKQRRIRGVREYLQSTLASKELGEFFNNGFQAKEKLQRILQSNGVTDAADPSKYAGIFADNQFPTVKLDATKTAEDMLSLTVKVAANGFLALATNLSEDAQISGQTAEYDSESVRGVADALAKKYPKLTRERLEEALTEGVRDTANRFTIARKQVAEATGAERGSILTAEAEHGIMMLNTGVFDNVSVEMQLRLKEIAKFLGAVMESEELREYFRKASGIKAENESSLVFAGKGNLVAKDNMGIGTGLQWMFRESYPELRIELPPAANYDHDIAIRPDGEKQRIALVSQLHPRVHGGEGHRRYENEDPHDMAAKILETNREVTVDTLKKGLEKAVREFNTRVAESNTYVRELTK